MTIIGHHPGRRGQLHLVVDAEGEAELRRLADPPTPSWQLGQLGPLSGMPVLRADQLGPEGCGCPAWMTAPAWDQLTGTVTLTEAHDHLHRNLVALRAEWRGCAVVEMVTPAALRDQLGAELLAQRLALALQPWLRPDTYRWPQLVLWPRLARLEGRLRIAWWRARMRWRWRS